MIEYFDNTTSMLDKNKSESLGFDFSEDPERASTLPGYTYYEHEWFEREKCLIFGRSWRCVGHISEIPNPGDYLSDSIVDQPVFVLRTKDGTIKGYHNACKHRAHPLITEKSGTLTAQLITCPYHAWAYDTNGALRSAPHCEAIRDFDKNSISLDPVKIEIVMGFIFVNPDTNSESLSAQIAPGIKRFMAHLPDIENYRLADQVTFDIAANWKNVGDNLLECYHCHPAHKAFIDLVDMDSYVVEANGIWSWQGGTCRAQNAAYRLPDGLSDYEREFVTFYIWPDLAFTLFPGSNIMATFLFAATEPECTHQVFSIYSPDGKLDSVAHQIVDYFRDVLGPEDVALVENVQKGLHSMSYERGRFMVDPARSYYSEHAVHHLHNLVVSHMKQDG